LSATQAGNEYTGKEPTAMTKLFISHSSQDDDFVRELRAALADHRQDVWIDSRELGGGDPLWSDIQMGIEGASAYAVVISTDALQSKWVGKELRYALGIQKERGKDKYPVIPLSLNDTKLGVLEEFFDEEPIYIAVTSDPGGIEAAMHPILVALGERLPTDVRATPQPKAEPLEELVLELTDLKFQEHEGVRCASARARLVYEAATPGQPDVYSAQQWRLVAPIGPIEADDLRWYLEQYAIWPSEIAAIQERAQRVEASLHEWGRLLYEAAMPVVHTSNVMQAWARIDDHAGRRFSVYMDTTLEAGAPETEVQAAQEVATVLLGLPWELLHDGKRYLFQGARPTRVRRRLPATEGFDVPVVATPIRILLVTARPEDEACGYIDHRVSALPLIEAMEALPGLVEIQVLSPPTLPALREELDRAHDNRRPYQVVHFDGHGIYDHSVGLGGLCFEHPGDTAKPKARRHLTVYTNELGPLLRDHRIPLVFLEACQTAMAEKASESVASELLNVGVASVVAMSHSVLVETARRFVAAFYHELAAGKRVGDAMLAGQRTLKDDTTRGRVFGARELQLEDWFVPVLFQEKDDPQLFKTTHTKQTREDFQTALAARLGGLPPIPETGFIGRSRELLALQRLLGPEGGGRYAVVRGQGGEGKTALAAEFARWMVRSHQIHRSGFVSVEIHGNQRSVVDALGKQLVSQKFSAAGDLDDAIQEIERALREQATLLVMDNMESVLLPPFMLQETPEALSEEAREELEAILTLCERWLKMGDTRLVFTSREALPSPFGAEPQRIELRRLDRDDAVKLVERVLNTAGADAAATGNTAREAIEQLVGAVHCHARTLALLAPVLRSHGVEATRASLVELMGEMERRFPGSREQSVFASVELSLQRLSAVNRDRARVLGVFHGGVSLAVLHQMMQWEKADVISLATELVKTGLATPDPYDHLTLNPALCPYLRERLDAKERATLTAHWNEAMDDYVKVLQQQRDQDAELSATLTRLELANLFALLERVQAAGDATATIDLATALYRLLRDAGKPRLLARVGEARDAAEKTLGGNLNHAAFEAQSTRIEQQLAGGHLPEALDGAQKLLQRAKSAGEKAYPAADYDLAMAHYDMGKVLESVGGSEQALPLLKEAGDRFETIEQDRPDQGAARMATLCLSARGNCLLDLGRLNEAAAVYKDAIVRSEELGDTRHLAAAMGQLGTVRLRQGLFQYALKAHKKARDVFTGLEDSANVAASWHMIGRVCQQAGQTEDAEIAYRNSLQIDVQIGNIARQADTLCQLGNLYDNVRNRPKEASAFYRQAVGKFVEIDDTFGEGYARADLAATLHRLKRFDEARGEIKRAIACKSQFGHASEPWASWDIRAAIETDDRKPAAATQARDNAKDAYLAYRRDGGENHQPHGRIVLEVAEHLLAGDPDVDAEILEQLDADSELPDWLRPFLRTLQAIAAGSRDRTLADTPELDYTMAAEVLLLIETLENAGR
jgi:tetratricopeptide (TPR) repeat protein